MGNLSIINQSKILLNKSHRDIIKEIDERFEDLSEDIDMAFDDLECKFKYKFQKILESK